MTTPVRADGSEEMTLGQYADVVRRRWRWVVAGVALSLAVAGVMVWQATPTYRSTATITVSPIVGTGGAGAVTAVADQVELMRGTRARDAVVERIGAPVDASFSEGPEDTLSVRIAAQSPDAERAALIATAYVEVFAEILMQLDLERVDKAADVLADQLADAEEALEAAREDGAVDKVPELDSQRRLYVEQLRALEDQRGFIEQGRVTVVSAAEVPTAPFEPRPSRSFALALVIGLLIGLGAAFVREHLNDRLETREAVERHLGGVTVIGVVPLAPAETDGTLDSVVAHAGATSAVVEAYRSARTALQFLQVDGDRRMVQITSPTQGDGKSTSIAHLAIGLARADRRVLVVDLDLRRPRQHELFGVHNDTGFTSVLLDPGVIDEAIRAIPTVEGLHLLTSGPIPPDPSELLAGRRARSLLAELAERYDVVLVDSPPVLGVSDPSVVAGLVDGTIVVVRAGRARRGEVTSALEQLRNVGANLMGAIVVGVDARHHRYGYGYYTATNASASSSAASLSATSSTAAESSPTAPGSS